MDKVFAPYICCFSLVEYESMLLLCQIKFHYEIDAINSYHCNAHCLSHKVICYSFFTIFYHCCFN